MTAPLSTEVVANWFINKAKEEGISITAMKLQKLIYYAHGWCLGLYKTALVEDQAEAWTFGPVFPHVYHLAKSYGSRPISSLLSNIFDEPSLIAEGDPRIPLLEKIWKIYSKYTALELSDMTHEPGGPWHKTIQQNPGRLGTDIPDEELIIYFQNLRQNP
jgi:uncharacterized phage-associated protein